MKNVLLLKAILVLFLLFLSGSGFGQSDSVKLDDLSLKDLLNVKIVSVSKTSESLFDAPLSASVLSREEIRKSGCTSIMEALRLVPGMIVREQSNGNYDIHLRGMDNVPPNAPFDVTSNTTTLVMVDNRPVYSYLKGGTFWETLPVDLNDVEKIEVIRGPAAALYGPNAVNGVINILTRHPEKDGAFLVANASQGSNHTIINNASAGFRINDQWSVVASGNYQHRDRTQTSYFEYNRNKWLDHPAYFIDFHNDTISNVNQLYPDPRLAMEKYAGNVFLNYDPAEKVKFNLSAGAQHSLVQKVSTENNITPLSSASSDSRYADFSAHVKGFAAQVSYNEGTQVPEYGPGNKYDFHTFDANMEYNYIAGNFSLKPGLSYKSAIYDDTKYSDTANKTGIFNTRGLITTQSASLRGEYRLLDNKLRMVAGFSTNTFNYPDTTYLAFEFAATYKINKKHLIRAVYSQAPRSSNIFNSFVDQNIIYYPSGYRNYNEIAVVGNKDLKLLTADMLEIGYRGSIGQQLSVDVEMYDTHGKNFSTPAQDRTIMEFNGADTIHEKQIKLTNLPLILEQQGITVSFTYIAKNLQIKPFITVQHTIMKNYAPFNNTPEADVPGAEQNNIYSAMGAVATLKSTPSVFGGGSINYALTKKINLNTTAYYYSAQTYDHISNLLFNDGIRGIDHINAKLILNANVSYEAVKGLHFFISGKNLLNDKSREFFRTDAVPVMFLGGINFEL